MGHKSSKAQEAAAPAPAPTNSPPADASLPASSGGMQLNRVDEIVSNVKSAKDPLQDDNNPWKAQNK
jgi:hypothetical protein